MAVIKHSGQNTISTLAGQIKLEEGNGRLVVYNSDTGRETTVVDIDGLTFDGGANGSIQLGNQENGNIGLETFDGAGNGVNLIGQAPTDRRGGMWNAKPGTDVDALLGAP